ncbi:MAG: discoidin domain-containing protein [Clostridia bacterium]|nr:discoidin domain-containing protein [Clostridia bacterium]
MKKLLAVLLALTMVAMLAVGASAGIFEYDESDGDYWDLELNVLDQESDEYILVTQDGTIAGAFGDPSGFDGSDYNQIEWMKPGWYPAVWADTADKESTDLSNVKGKVAICLRGNITFDQKCLNVMEAGAIAAFICNNYRDDVLIDEETNELESVANTGMTEYHVQVPNAFLTSDIGTKLICEVTGKTYAEVIPEMLKVGASETTFTGIAPASETYIFIGTFKDYQEIGEFSADKLVDVSSPYKDGNGITGELPPPAEIEVDALEIPADAAKIANDGNSYDDVTAAAKAIGSNPIKSYTFMDGSAGNGGEGPENLWDDDTTTKFCTSSFPTISTAKTDEAYSINGIIMATANDNSSYNGRSPNEWAVFGSKDGESWDVIAVGDDTFFEETDFTYYAAKIDATEAYNFFQFQGTGAASGTFQVSELVLCSADAASYPASGESGNIMIGTVIGNETGWDGTAGSGAASAFDGKANTFFDPLGQGDGYCGMQMSEPYILEKVAILSRHVDTDYNSRFKGAQIQGSNDGENWTSLWQSDTTGTAPEYYIVTEFENNTGYTMFRYFNDADHGDVAEVEFYGQPGKVKAPAAEEPKTEEPAPAAEEPTPAAEEPTPAAEEPTPAAETPTETPAADNKPAETAKRGCGSMIGGGFIVLVTLLGSAWIAKRK